MTISRYSLGLAVLMLPMAAFAHEPDLTPRSPLEKIVLGDATVAKSHLEELAQAGWPSRESIVAELLEAGFTRDRGYRDCEYYGYHRRTTEAGAARSIQLALCPTGKPMVLVMDMLPPGKRGGGMGQSGERKNQ